MASNPEFVQYIADNTMESISDFKHWRAYHKVWLSQAVPTGGIPCDPDEISSRAGAGWLCTENRVSRSAFTHGILSHPPGAQPSADSAGIGGMGRAIVARLLFYIRREPPRLPAERTPYEHQRIFTNAEADRLRVILKSRSHQRNFGLLFYNKFCVFSSFQLLMT